MPKKKRGMTPEEQIEKFRETVRELTGAGELSPTEADEALEKLMNNAVKIKQVEKNAEGHFPPPNRNTRN